MKKITLLSLLMMMMFSFAITSCSSCTSKSEESPVVVEEDSVVSAAALVVENTVSMDRQDMFLNYQNDYRWYETCIVLNDFLDSENTDSSVFAVSNIFQYAIDRDDNSVDTRVVMFTHTVDTMAVDVKHAFWVGDCILNEDEIKLTFNEAYDRLMQANLPKPHSKQVVLRKELGPKIINPQYIFGNVQSHVYVDAVTGDVSTTNPAYNGFELAAPLGEWP